MSDPKPGKLPSRKVLGDLVWSLAAMLLLNGTNDIHVSFLLCSIRPIWRKTVPEREKTVYRSNVPDARTGFSQGENSQPAHNVHTTDAFRCTIYGTFRAYKRFHRFAQNGRAPYRTAQKWRIMGCGRTQSRSNRRLTELPHRSRE